MVHFGNEILPGHAMVLGSCDFLDLPTLADMDGSLPHN